MYAIRAAAPFRRVMATQSSIARAMATSAHANQAAQNGSPDGATTPRAAARKQLLTLGEIDRLLTHVSRECSTPKSAEACACIRRDRRLHRAKSPCANAPSVRNATTPSQSATDSPEHSPKTKSDTPMVMRAHPVPWMNAGCGAPELEPPAKEKAEKYPPLDEGQKEALVKPKHMGASYTSFDLPLASDPRLYDLYVNFSGGFRESSASAMRVHCHSRHLPIADWSGLTHRHGQAAREPRLSRWRRRL